MKRVCMNRKYWPSDALPVGRGWLATVGPVNGFASPSLVAERDLCPKYVETLFIEIRKLLLPHLYLTSPLMLLP